MGLGSSWSEFVIAAGIVSNCKCSLQFEIHETILSSYYCSLLEYTGLNELVLK